MPVGAARKAYNRDVVSGATTSVVRMLARFARPREDPDREREATVDVAGEARGMTIYLPPGPPERAPGWILLHGVTVRGRHHDAVRRMGRALAAAGHVVVAPEVPRWTALRLTAHDAEPVVHATLDALRRRPDVDAARVGLMGFSVVATWALGVAAGLDTIRAVAGFGGFADLKRTVRAMVIGEHEWAGRDYRFTPDPYGRWIVGAEWLPLLDDRWGPAAARARVADALRHLAHVSGLHGAAGSSPVYDPLIAHLRAAVPASGRRVWDLLAPPAAERPARDAGLALADALVDAALAADPRLQPHDRLRRLGVPTILLHGRADVIVPFTETLRLATLLPATAEARVTITQLIGHTKTAEAGTLGNPATTAAELGRLASAMAVLARVLSR